MKTCRPVLAWIAGVLLALSSTALHAAADKKDEKKWDVANPPGAWASVPIDTSETTWSSVDISPDGKTIVFDMLGDLYAIPSEGGEAKPLTEGIPWDTEPRFSPDGKKIAFISDRGGADNLWLMNADGTNPTAVTEEKEHLVHNPSWSADGEYLVAKKDFTSTRSIAAGEIWLFSVGGGGGLVLVERPDGAKAQKTIAEPALSPDGRYLYYSQDTTPGRVWQYDKDSTGRIFSIRRLDRKNGEVDTIVEGAGGAIRPTPSRDGKSLAYVKRTPDMVSALYVKDLASGTERPVYTRLDRDLQETDGSQGNTTAFAWTPDGTSIVFWAGGKIRRVNVRTKEDAVIPVHVKTSRKVAPAVRFPVDVAPAEFDVKMPRWAQLSPDGSRIVFQALGRLYVRDAKGGAPRRLTAQTDHTEFHPSFSRDGQWIAYTTWNDEAYGSLRVVPAGGGEGRAVTKDPGHYVEPRFSPDGKWLVFRKVTDGYMSAGAWSMDPGVYLIPASGGEAKLLSKNGVNAQFGAASDRVFFSEPADETNLHFKSVNLDGVDARTHLKSDEATEFAVSPDGRFVAFTAKWNVFVAPFASTGKPVDIGSGTKAIPVKQVSKRSGESLHWSGDGKALHWSHGPTLYTRDLKDAFAFLAGAPDKLPEPVEEGTDLKFRVPSDRPAGTIVLKGARIVTLRDADARQEIVENGVVVVKGNRIEAVGPASSVAIPEGAAVFDVSGKTIVPGFVDAHAHGPFANEGLVPDQNWMQLANLAFGVTTIHDPSNDTASVFAAAELQKAGLVVAPRIFSTGTILYGAHEPSVTADVDSLDDAAFHVRRLKEAGAISVKSYQLPRRDQRQQILAAARDLGMMVVPEGGAKYQSNMTQIVDGHTGIEHATPLVRLYDDARQLWSEDQGRLHADVRRRLRRHLRRELLVRPHGRVEGPAPHDVHPALHRRTALHAPHQGPGRALQPRPRRRGGARPPLEGGVGADRRARPARGARRPLGDLEHGPGRLHPVGGVPQRQPRRRALPRIGQGPRLDRAREARRPRRHRRQAARGHPRLREDRLHDAQRPPLRREHDGPGRARQGQAQAVLLRKGRRRHDPPGHVRVARARVGAVRLGRLAWGRPGRERTEPRFVPFLPPPWSGMLSARHPGCRMPSSRRAAAGGLLS